MTFPPGSGPLCARTSGETGILEHPRLPRRVTIAVLVVSAFSLFIPALSVHFSGGSSSRFAVAELNPQPAPAVSFYSEELIRPREMQLSVHSATLAETSNGGLLAVWYGGSGEGRSDVALYRSTWDPSALKWSRVERLQSRHGTARDLGLFIKKMGNAVLMNDRNGKLWLFYVTTSIGGWSCSAVNVQTSLDEGKSWSAARRLFLGPFFNVSTLVKGIPFLYADGSIGLPVYHELINDFPELVRIGGDGAVLDKVRLADGPSMIQPWIAPLDSLRAVALMRQSVKEAGHVFVVRTSDGGQSWSAARPGALRNRNSAVTSLRLSDGSVIAVFNDSDLDRSDLSLARSTDAGESWRHIWTFEHGAVRDKAGAPAEFSYPWLLETRNGTIHLVYSHRRTGVKHVMFNEPWILAQGPGQ